MVEPTTHGRLLVIGDVHRHWDRDDPAYIAGCGADHVLFVGDLGDEDLDIVQEIASLPIDKAVILGNHDAWASFKQGRPTDVLRASLQALGDDHLGYARRELPALGVTMLGARPFSWGGPSLRRAEIYQELYGIGSFEESAERLVELARRARHSRVIILAHNGPSGLGNRPHDIYGKDFGKPGGDWGDLDLRLAIERIKDELHLEVPLVVAGHMHSRIMAQGDLRRTHLVRLNGTVYVNPAEVPRVVQRGERRRARHYTEVRMSEGLVTEVRSFFEESEGEEGNGLEGPEGFD
jgi:uncharacterized protein (TIGR04168 family)